MLVRATVTDLRTEVSMTATEAAGPAWCAAPTTASSSEPTSTPRTTAASTLTAVEAGGPGLPGVAAAGAVEEVSGAGTGSARARAVLTPPPPRPGYATVSPAHQWDININTRDLTSNSSLASITDRDSIIMDNISLVNLNLGNINPDNMDPDNIKQGNINLELDNISMDRITTGNTISKIINC